MFAMQGPKVACNEAVHGPRRLAGLAAGLALGLTMALAAGPGLAASPPQCRADLWEENWIRVENLDRSLKIYVQAIGFSEQLVERRTLPEKLAKDGFKTAEVRIADLCRAHGPVKTLRVIEAPPDMIDLPLEDQILLMQFHVQDLNLVVERLPEGLAESGAWGIMGGETSFVFEDFDGNRIILTGE